MSPNFISRRDATDALCYAWISSRAVPSLFHVADASSDYHTRHHRLVIVPSFLPPISLLWSAFSTAVARASSHLLALAHALRNLLPKPRQVLPELLGSVDVGRGLVVGRREPSAPGSTARSPARTPRGRRPGSAGWRCKPCRRCTRWGATSRSRTAPTGDCWGSPWGTPCWP